MKNPYARWLVGLLWCLVLNSAGAETITLWADQWCPYNCEPTANKPGYMVEIAKRVFEKAGHIVAYKAENWSRALEEARAGKIHGVIGANAAEVKENGLVIGTVPLGIELNCFYVLQTNNWHYDGIASLHDIVVGGVQGYNYNDLLNPYVKGHPKQFELLSGDDGLSRNIRKLKMRRIGALIANQNTLLYELASTKETDIREAGCDHSVKQRGLYIAFSSKHPQAGIYAKLLSDGVNAMRQRGELQNLLNSYGIKDWAG